MTKQALVTGANGFVGEILCRRLLNNGWEVRRGVFGVPCTRDWEQACDMSVPHQIDRLIQWARPFTHVFHLAALTFVPDSINAPDTTMTVNVNGTIHVIDALRKWAPEARMVYVGSAGAYGQPRELPVTEEHPLCPLTPYDISKAAADQYCAFASGATDLDIVRTRPFNHSGRGQTVRFVLPAFARQLAQIEAGQAAPEFRVGNLSASRDFLHVDDIVAAYEAVALRGKPGEVYNICSGKGTVIRDALDLLLALSDTEVKVTVDEERLRPADAPEVIGSHDRVTADTGWNPEVPFEQILVDLLDEWRERVQAGSDS